MTRHSKRLLVLRIGLLVVIGAPCLFILLKHFGPRFGVTPFRSIKTQIAPRQIDDSAPPLSAAEDWPAWHGPHGDGISREVLPEAWPVTGLKQRWSASVGLGYASPIAAGGRIYLFSLDSGRDALTCFDARTGHVIWNDESDTGWKSNYPGTRATPIIDTNAIYTFGGMGDLTRRDRETGKPVWHINTLPPGSAPLGYGCGSNPLMVGGKIFLQGGKDGPVAVAVDKETGQVLWRSEASGIAGYAQPILADVTGTPQLVIFAGDTIFGMEPESGKTIWKRKWATDYQVNSSTPVYSPADQDLFVTSSYGMGCVMLHLNPTAEPAKLWQTKAIKSKFQKAILDSGYLYGDSDGRIKCISWPDGAAKWETTPDDIKLGDNSAIVRSGDKLLILNSDTGELALMHAAPDGFRVLGSSPGVSGTELFSTPLLYAGRIYVKGSTELICFDAR